MKFIRGIHNLNEQHRGCVLTIGNFDRARRGRTASNGARTGGLNENPKIASRMTSEVDKADSSCSTLDGSEGMDMFKHCVFKR